MSYTSDNYKWMLLTKDHKENILRVRFAYKTDHFNSSLAKLFYNPIDKHIDEIQIEMSYNLELCQDTILGQPTNKGNMLLCNLKSLNYIHFETFENKKLLDMDVFGREKVDAYFSAIIPTDDKNLMAENILPFVYSLAIKEKHSSNPLLSDTFSWKYWEANNYCQKTFLDDQGNSKLIVYSQE